MRAAQEFIASGRRVVVDIDIERFFDRVNHDILMGLVAPVVWEGRGREASPYPDSGRRLARRGGNG